MTPAEFDKALAATLRLCRTVAQENLPLDDMCLYVFGAEFTPRERDALLDTIQVVRDAAEIGVSLPPDPTPIRVPDAPDAGGPTPANLLRGTWEMDLPTPSGATDPLASGWWYDSRRCLFALGKYPVLTEAWSEELIRDLAKHPAGEILPDFARRLLAGVELSRQRPLEAPVG
jgi:hypothetical protein